MLTSLSIAHQSKSYLGLLDRTIIYHTPLEYAKTLSERYQADIWLKREDLQKVRSFKVRGAYCMISQLSDDQKTRGVVCASAGNHAQGVALSCASFQIPGVVFMPQTASEQKIRKTKHFGGEYITVQLVGDSFDDAYAAAQEYCHQTGAVFVHPFDDPAVIAGQGTLGYEMMEQFAECYDGATPDIVALAVGGWGLIAGVGSVVRYLSPDTQIWGIESSGSASMTKSLEQGHIVTLERVDAFADGVAVKTPGQQTFALAQELVDEMVVVDDGQTATMMLSLLDDQGIVTEPAGALALACLEQQADQIRGKSVICVVCGGNFDFARLPNVEEKSLRYRGLKRYFIINFPQRPWALREFLDILWPDDDIVRFEYIKKTAKERWPALVGIQSKDNHNFDLLVDRMMRQSIVFDDITHKDLYFDLLV